MIKQIIISILLLLVTTDIYAYSSKKKVRWKLAATWGETLHPIIDVPKEMARLVRKMSNNRFIIRIDSSNKHKSPFGVFDMVKSGSYEMAHSASYFWKGKDINLMPFSGMPFGMNMIEQSAWFYHGGGMELMQQAYKKYNLLSFPGGNTGIQMGGWFNKEINELSDLKGLKMRIPGFAGEIISELGVSVVNIAPGELYTSLERGLIDALEWVSPSLDMKMGFNKIAKYYYHGWHEPASELQFLVSKDKFDALPKDLQEILKSAMQISGMNMYLKINDMNKESWEIIQNDNKVEIKNFSNDILLALYKTNNELIKKISEKNPLFKKIIESQNKYKLKMRKWTESSEFKYISNMRNIDAKSH